MEDNFQNIGSLEGGLGYVFLHIPVLSNDKNSTFMKGKAFSKAVAETFLNSETIRHYASSYLKDERIETYLKLRFASDKLADLLDVAMFRYSNLTYQEMARYFVLTIDLYGGDEALEFLDVTKLPEQFYVNLKETLGTIKKFLIMMEKIKEK